MKRVAIIGATGQIGAALSDEYAARDDVSLTLYSRQPEKTRARFAERDADVRHLAIAELDLSDVDIVINSIGIGDPANAGICGPEFYDLTMTIEDRIDAALAVNRTSLTVFMSSGAVYGTFDGPATEATPVQHNLNEFPPGVWYGRAKLAAELRHRAQTTRKVLDIRVFGFLSQHLDIGARYLVSEAFRAILTGKELLTSPERIRRDFIGAPELAAMIDAAYTQPAINLAVDSYSLLPATKFEILECLEPFGLRWRIGAPGEPSLRIDYWSKMRAAAALGYQPQRSSLHIVRQTAEHFLGGRQKDAPSAGLAL